MSYILDALKKAEVAENPDMAAAQFVHDSQVQRQQRWLLFAAAALILNALVLLFLFNPWRNDGPPVTADQISGQTASNQSIAEPVIANATSNSPRTAVGQWPDAPPPASPTAQPRRSTLITLDRLPAADRSDYPAMVFSTHIFAEDQDLRALFINGRRRQEGDFINEAQLLEITETGAVIGFRGYRIRVPVVGGWE